MRNSRWLAAAVLPLALASCGVFFAPLEGRWNPNDPDFGAGYNQQSLYPTVDGYVGYGYETFYEGATMQAGSGSYLALMKFDTGDIPKDVPHAELRLYLDTTLSYEMPFRVRLILADWDASSVGWTAATTDGFVAPSCSPTVSVNSAGWYSWDVTDLLRSVNPGSVKGLLVESTEAGTTAYFWTTEQSTNQPHLVVWTR
jgi:hypothetical protein